MRVQGQIDFTIIERTDERVVAEMPITGGMKNPFGTSLEVIQHAGKPLTIFRSAA